MKFKKFKRLAAVLIAATICAGTFANSAQAMTVSGTTSLEGQMVLVNRTDVEETSNSINGEMKSVIPVYDANKQHMNTAKFTQNINSITVSGAPAGHPYQYVGHADYSKMYTCVVEVEYAKDANGYALKDENGNYIVKSIKDVMGNPVTSNGEVTTDLNAYYDALNSGPYSMTFFLKDGDGNIASGYCVRMGVETVKNAWYSVSNLDDGNYYATEDAENHVRAIVLNGYWGTANTNENGQYATGSLERVKADLKKAMREGKVQTTYNITHKDANNAITTSKVTVTEEMVDELLTEGIALEMTQAAIWSWSNGSQAVLNGEDGYILVDVIHTQKKNPENSAIRKILYNYLFNLEPQEAKTVVIDEKNFIDDLKLVVSEDDNTEDNIYDVDLQFSLVATPSANDDLVLEIGYNEDKTTVRLAGTNNGTEDYPTLTAQNGVYTLSGLSLEEGKDFKITMHMVGEQQLVRDAYMYVAEGGFETSQPMVGISEGTRSVDVSMSANVNFHLDEYKERIINIHKKASAEDGQVALAGVKFDMYYICTMGEFERNYSNYVTDDKRVKQSVIDGLTKNDLVATLTTGTNGTATYNLTANGEPDGLYLFVERQHGATQAPIAPFYATVPMTNADGTGYEYTIDITPKNSVVGGPKIRKDVTEIENNWDSFDVNKEHTWIIRTDVPVDLGEGKEYMDYTINDTLDYRLSLKYLDNQEADMVVKVSTDKDAAADSEPSANVLEKVTHYTVTTDTKTVTVDGAEETVDTFTVKLTSAGMAKVAKIAGASYADSEIRVYFKAVIDEDASMGELIPNDATLSYTNSVNFHYDEKSDIAEVVTGGTKLLKVDAADNKTTLAGATFKVYRPATAEEIEDENVIKENIKNVSVPVIPVKFYDNAELEGDKVSDVTSGADGIIIIYGLAYNDAEAEGDVYYVVETKAPDGYNLLTKPVEFKITETSHLEGNEIKIENSGGFELPETGGIGTTIFTMTGLILMLGAGIILVTRRRMYL